LVLGWGGGKGGLLYGGRGGEYMRYDRKSGVYTFPDFERLRIGGLQGLFGELEEEATLEVGGVGRGGAAKG